MILCNETYPTIMAHEPVASSAMVDTSDWIHLENANGVLITVVDSYVVAANDLVLTVHESVDGTGTTALAIPWLIWSNLACETSDVLVRRADAITYTLTPSAGAGGIGMVQFYIAASILSAGFKWVQLGAGVGDAGNLCYAQYQLDGARYQQETPPTAIV